MSTAVGPSASASVTSNRPDHDWTPQHQSWNGGRNDRFYESIPGAKWDGNFGANVMGYFQAARHPVLLGARARVHAVRHVLLLGDRTDRAQPRVLGLGHARSGGQPGGPCLETVFNAEGLVGDFRWTTMPEQLQARGVSWKSYTAAVASSTVRFLPFASSATSRSSTDWDPAHLSGRLPGRPGSRPAAGRVLDPGGLH